MRHQVAVTSLTTGSAIDVTAINILRTYMTARHIDGSFTCHCSELKLIRPTERKAGGLFVMFSYACCICGIRDVTHRGHSTSTIDSASNMTALDVDNGTTTNKARLRVVMLLTVISPIGVRTTTGSIDVTSICTDILIDGIIIEVPPRIILTCNRILICNTDGTAIDVHYGILVVVTILTATIDRTLDKRSRPATAAWCTDVDNGSSHPCNPIVLV